MLSVLLMILKVLGIIVLILLGTILLLILLVLFVPVRYQVMLHRKEGEETPVTVKVKVTWLLHVLNAAFSYPEAAFLRVRIFCFTIFRSDHSKEDAGEESAQDKAARKEIPKKERDLKEEAREKEIPRESVQKENSCEEAAKEGTAQKERVQKDSAANDTIGDEKTQRKSKSNKKKNKFLEFFRKLLSLFKNIKYTILKIYDKIKHIVKNIQYYIRIVQSDTFKQAWNVCSGQALSLLKSILPGIIRGNLLIGTGDPAGTGQILAAYGILYPLIGNHIDIVPDFERQIIEGDLLLKGKITVFKALKTAWIVYFNKDLRRLIKLFKREAA